MMHRSILLAMLLICLPITSGFAIAGAAHLMKPRCVQSICMSEDATDKHHVDEAYTNNLAHMEHHRNSIASIQQRLHGVVVPNLEVPGAENLAQQLIELESHLAQHESALAELEETQRTLLRERLFPENRMPLGDDSAQ